MILIRLYLYHCYRCPKVQSSGNTKSPRLVICLGEFNFFSHITNICEHLESLFALKNPHITSLITQHSYFNILWIVCMKNTYSAYLFELLFTSSPNRRSFKIKRGHKNKLKQWSRNKYRALDSWQSRGCTWSWQSSYSIIVTPDIEWKPLGTVPYMSGCWCMCTWYLLVTRIYWHLFEYAEVENWVLVIKHI